MLFRINHFLGTDNRRVAIMLFIVAFTGGLRIFFIFTSFARLPLGDSTTILFSSPVIVMVLSMFILHERCGIFRMVAATTLIGGVILISKPPFIFGHDENLGYDAIGKTECTAVRLNGIFLSLSSPSPKSKVPKSRPKGLRLTQ